MVYNSNKFLSSDEKAIFSALLYSNIFGFPLTQDELWRFIINSKQVKKAHFLNALGQLQKRKVVAYEGYYCLQGREAICKERKRYLPEVSKKLKLAQKVAVILSAIPTVECIGISGGLAVKQVTPEDDIDFFLIVRKNTLFVSRFWILFLLSCLRVRRSRKQKEAANTVCVNLMIDETKLAWPPERQDSYTAHEIAQMLPLFVRHGMYQKFIEHNRWVERYLPHALEALPMPQAAKKISGITLLSRVLMNSFFEKLSRFLQMSLMRQHQTREIITNHVLALHPNDYRIKILKQLRLKMRQFGLLTNI